MTSHEFNGISTATVTATRVKSRNQFSDFVFMPCALLLLLPLLLLLLFYFAKKNTITHTSANSDWGDDDTLLYDGMHLWLTPQIILLTDKWYFPYGKSRTQICQMKRNKKKKQIEREKLQNEKKICPKLMRRPETHTHAQNTKLISSGAPICPQAHYINIIPQFCHHTQFSFVHSVIINFFFN